jgi:hypothetical protein
VIHLRRQPAEWACTSGKRCLGRPGHVDDVFRSAAIAGVSLMVAIMAPLEELDRPAWGAHSAAVSSHTVECPRRSAMQVCESCMAPGRISILRLPLQVPARAFKRDHCCKLLGTC